MMAASAAILKANDVAGEGGGVLPGCPLGGYLVILAYKLLRK